PRIARHRVEAFACASVRECHPIGSRFHVPLYGWRCGSATPPPAREPAGVPERAAVQATVHCLTGCAIGEILGMVIATALGLANLPSILLAIALAFVFGFGVTVLSLRRAGVPLRRALSLAFASDTISIAVMELVDNAFI